MTSGTTRAALAAGAVAAAYLRVADPHDPAVAMPRCPFHALTGLHCPGCGGLRMAHDLLAGDLRGAARDNLLLLVTSPLLAAILVRRLRRGEQPPRWLAYGLAGAAVTWAVVRNLPGFPLRPTLTPAGRRRRGGRAAAG